MYNPQAVLAIVGLYTLLSSASRIDLHQRRQTHQPPQVNPLDEFTLEKCPIDPLLAFQPDGGLGPLVEGDMQMSATKRSLEYRRADLDEQSSHHYERAIAKRVFYWPDGYFELKRCTHVFQKTYTLARFTQTSRILNTPDLVLKQGVAYVISTMFSKPMESIKIWIDNGDHYSLYQTITESDLMEDATRWIADLQFDSNTVLHVQTIFKWLGPVTRASPNSIEMNAMEGQNIAQGNVQMFATTPRDPATFL